MGNGSHWKWMTFRPFPPQPPDQRLHRPRVVQALDAQPERLGQARQHRSAGDAVKAFTQRRAAYRVVVRAGSAAMQHDLVPLGLQARRERRVIRQGEQRWVDHRDPHRAAHWANAFCAGAALTADTLMGIPFIK